MSKREDRVRELLACADSPLSAEQLNARKADAEKTFSMDFLLSVPGVRFDGRHRTFKIGPQPTDEETVRRWVREELLKFHATYPSILATADTGRKGSKTIHDWHPGQMGADPTPDLPKLISTTHINLVPEPSPENDYHPTEEQIVAEVEEQKKEKALEYVLAALCEAAEDAEGIEPPEGSKSAGETLATPTISDEELASLKAQFEADKAPAKNPAQEMALALKNGAILRLTGEATGRSVQFEMAGGKLMQDGREADMADPRTLAGKFIAPLFSKEPHFRDGARYELEELF